ncbi:MAG: thioesterase family protein, partial [Candidatus Rokuibacteriota bacterium]
MGVTSGLKHRRPEFIGKSPDPAILRRAGQPDPSCVPREGAIAEAADVIASQYTCLVRPEWIDNNGHMNMGYYVVVFDLATDEWMRRIGLDAAHR